MGNKISKKQAQLQQEDAAAGGGGGGGGGTAATSAGSSSSSSSASRAGAGNDGVVVSSELTIDSFTLMKVLGKGSFGKVMLCRKNDDPDGQLYAMKTLRKSELIRRNQLAHTATEREILHHLNSPFLVSLHYAFQTSEKLYLVLDYCSGGELFHWLKASRRFSEPRARLYAAELTCAIECLHANDIIYRDLKPENILLDAEGHIKITDFGLSKDGVVGAGAEGGTKTFCGTPEYLAPEILENRGHGKAVDWWSLGTLLYEMLCGLPPFYDTNVQRMYSKILQAPIKWPPHVSADAKDILQGLLQRRVNDRLGSGQGDADELKATAFFASLDFEQVMAKGYTPEFTPPQARGDTDVGNFDREFTEEKAIDSVVVSNLSQTAQEKAHFDGFTYQGSNMAGGDGDEDGAQAK